MPMSLVHQYKKTNLVVGDRLDILGPGRFRPGPPRILKTRDVAHRISSVGRGLAPFL